MGIFDEIFPDLASELMDLFSGDTPITITVETGDYDFREDETLESQTPFTLQASPPLFYTDRELDPEANILSGDAKIYIAAKDLEEVGIMEIDPELHISLKDGQGKTWKIINSTRFASGDLNALFEVHVRA